MEDTMSEEFTCAACGKTCPKGRSDEEAMADSKLLWGEIAAEDLVVICDECFQRGVAEAHGDAMKDQLPN